MDITTLAIVLSKISQLRKEVKKDEFNVQVEQDRSILNNSGIEKIIYLLPKNEATSEDGYDEFIYANGAWEKVGSTDIDLSTYALKSEIPTKVSQLQNDSGFLIQHQDISGKADKATTLSGYGITDAQSKIDTNNKLSSDLIDDTNNTNKFVTSNEKTVWGTKYDKPSGGIPSTDLSAAVQTSLGKADTALQSYTEQYTGTVIGVTMNGNSLSPTDGVIDLGAVITAHQDIGGKADKATTLAGYGITDGETTSHKVTAVDSSATDTQYPSAKAVYEAIQIAIGNIETQLSQV